MIKNVLELAKQYNLALSDDQKEAFEDMELVDLYFDLEDPEEVDFIDPIYTMNDFNEIMSPIFEQKAPYRIVQMLNFNVLGIDFTFDWSQEYFSIDELDHLYSYSYKEVYDLFSEEDNFIHLVDLYTDQYKLETVGN